MGNNDVLNRYKQEMEEQYPLYIELTDNVFLKIYEMLYEDYDSMSSDKRKLIILKAYLKDILQIAFEGNGHKNYIKNVIRVMFDENIREFICKKVDTEKNEFLIIMEQLKHEITYWQGYEGCEEKKLYRLLEIVK